MPIRVTHLQTPSDEALSSCLAELRGNGHPYGNTDDWTPEAIDALPKPRQTFVASDEDGPLALLVLTSGFLETWGVPTDLLGANPVLPLDARAAALHTSLLLAASAWVEREGETGLETLLPMGSANMKRDERLDAFLGRLGFERFYFTMTRDLARIDGCAAVDLALEIAPAATLATEELYVNYAACVAHGEIELVSRQTSEERRAYFDSLADETLAHPGSLALFVDDRLLGFTLAAPLSETAAHLAWIGILPKHRSQGHGRQLLCDVMATCRERGIERMSLYTDTSISGRTLYERLGFRAAGALTYRWRRTAQ